MLLGGEINPGDEVTADVRDGTLAFAVERAPDAAPAAEDKPEAEPDLEAAEPPAANAAGGAAATTLTPAFRLSESGVGKVYLCQRGFRSAR